MEEELVSLQISNTYREKLRQLSKMDIRSMKGEFEWLVDEEWARRLSQPNPMVSIEEAERAAITEA